MANIVANEKSYRHSQKVRKQNHAKMSKLRTVVKKVRNSNDQSKLVEAYSVIDKTASKGVIHKNKANRLKSRTAKALNKAVAEQAA
ncbi:30S ribosomal protein S20 [Ureaplasma diversum]|uniref:Small ribosomal subunit protein bS20 n=2 Tax=Ureaplasma diversum TaxID=42094 RepID=A0A084EZ03_9BACT|nr:30S ribosomal protein S20 [Ureaplasma diversum]AJQ45123.1 30S ribosomal protein S20 [Ureaplasma diversum]KEZ23195.1 30S ribosomal protein S20 [Ureaplasma diversum NCTC 246]